MSTEMDSRMGMCEFERSCLNRKYIGSDAIESALDVLYNFSLGKSKQF